MDDTEIESRIQDLDTSSGLYFISGILLILNMICRWKVRYNMILFVLQKSTADFSSIILGNRYQPGYDPPIVAPAGQDIWLTAIIQLERTSTNF